LSDLLWLDAPTEAGWYWMKYWLSSKPAVINQVRYFAPHFVIDTSPLKDWVNWKFCGPLLEP